jgi:hypothetical protein
MREADRVDEIGFTRDASDTIIGKSHYYSLHRPGH